MGAIDGGDGGSQREDCYAAVDDLRCHGVAYGEPVVFEDHVVFASFHDPFGNGLQMCSDLP